jgi:hypothetical protein
MFWNKRKPHLKDYASPVRRLAKRLGVERRYSPRVLCPKIPTALLPAISFENRHFEVHNISVGGCCLLDPNGYLGPAVGHDVHLVLRWFDGSAVSVHSRIVSRVDHRRHIQFLNLPRERVKLIEQAIVPGILGEGMRVVYTGDVGGPLMQAREAWNSLKGDSLVITDHVHRLAQITMNGQTFEVFKEAWPQKDSKPLTEVEFANLILFLNNIPQPTDLLEAFIAHVEATAQRGKP